MIYFRKFNTLTLSFIFWLVNFGSVIACEIDVSDYVGYQIIYSGTVTGYIDGNGQKKNSFEGCEYERVLIVDYNKQIICAEYSYSYAYNPDIVVLANNFGRVACIDDDVYDIR